MTLTLNQDHRVVRKQKTCALFISQSSQSIQGELSRLLRPGDLMKFIHFYLIWSIFMGQSSLSYFSVKNKTKQSKAKQNGVKSKQYRQNKTKQNKQKPTLAKTKQSKAKKRHCSVYVRVLMTPAFEQFDS